MDVTYDVWMDVPGARGFSLVAQRISGEEADVWDRTCLHPINIEESQKGELTWQA